MTSAAQARASLGAQAYNTVCVSVCVCVSGEMGDKELMWALKNGDLDEVKTLLVKVRNTHSFHLFTYIHKRGQTGLTAREGL